MDDQYDRGRSPTRSPPTRSPPRDVSRTPSRARSRSPSRRRRDSRSRSAAHSLSRSRSPSPRSSRSPTPRRNGRQGSNSPGRPRGRSQGGDKKPTKIVIERLTKNVQEDHLHEIFGHYGEIIDLHLPINRQFNTNRGTAYLLYKHADEATVACASMHEGTIDGSVVHVSVCLPRATFQNGAIPVARRGATNIDPRVPPPNRRGPHGGRGFGGPPPRRRGGMSPGRYGPRYDVYRPRSESRSDGGRYRSRSRSYDDRRDRSRSPGRQGGGRRKRSLSRGSYDSYRDRSHSRTRAGRY